MKRLLVASVVLLVVLGSCGGSETTTTVPPHAPSTITTTSQSSRPPSTSTTMPVPTTRVPELPPLLVADADGIYTLVAGQATRFLDGQPAVFAVPDLRGGVVYQTEPHDITGMYFDEELGRNVHGWGESGPDSIWWIESPGAEPEALVTHADARLRLVDVVNIAGSPHVLYRQLIGGPGGEEPWLSVLEWLCVHDLETQLTQYLGLVGSYESSFTQMRFGGSTVAVGFEPYGGETATQVGLLSFEELGAQVEYNWLPRLTSDKLPFGPAADCSDRASCYGWAVVTVAEDGSRVSWVQGGADIDEHGDRPHPTELVAVDSRSQIEVLRIQLGPLSDEADLSHWASFIDDDGVNIVVSGAGSSGDAFALVGSDLTMLDLGPATISLWQTELGTPSRTFSKASPLTLRGDGLGATTFGMPTSEAVEELTLQIGPPSRQAFDMYESYYWDDLGLTVVFSSYDFYRDDGVEHMVGWSAWGNLVTPLRTSGGVGLGDSMRDFAAAHDGEIEIPTAIDECMPTHYVWLNHPGPGALERVMVALTGPATTDESVVTYLRAGAGYGC